MWTTSEIKILVCVTLLQQGWLLPPTPTPLLFFFSSFDFSSVCWGGLFLARQHLNKDEREEKKKKKRQRKREAGQKATHPPPATKNACLAMISSLTFLYESCVFELYHLNLYTNGKKAQMCCCDSFNLADYKTDLRTLFWNSCLIQQVTVYVNIFNLLVDFCR